jgi:apolipoprotein N-acyltransferase
VRSRSDPVVPIALKLDPNPLRKKSVPSSKNLCARVCFLRGSEVLVLFWATLELLLFFAVNWLDPLLTVLFVLLAGVFLIMAAVGYNRFNSRFRKVYPNDR